MRAMKWLGLYALAFGIGACGASPSAQLQYKLELTKERAGTAERVRQRLEVIGERVGVDVVGVTIAKTAAGIDVDVALHVADCNRFEGLRAAAAAVLANQRLTLHEVLVPEGRDLDAVRAAVGVDGDTQLERRGDLGYLIVRPLAGQDLDARIVAAGTDERRLVVTHYFKPAVPALELDYILVHVHAPKDELEHGHVAGARPLLIGDEPYIGLRLDEVGSRRLWELSQRVAGRYLAFLVDGRALSVPVGLAAMMLSELPLSLPDVLGEGPDERRARMREFASTLATGPLADTVVITGEDGYCPR